MTAENNTMDDTAFRRAAGDNDAPMSVLGEPTNLINLIRDGIPPVKYVPGCEGWLVAGKRYLIPAPAGTGKSMLALIICTGIVAAGGTAVILDVENGADEYARRLKCILDANDNDNTNRARGTLADACQTRLVYYAWPRLNLQWDEHQWSSSTAGADVVVFDSSRFMLSTVGLQENVADDYAEFATAFLLPLSKNGTATIMLDNTGQQDADRARGTKAKDDLNEVVYALSSIGKTDTTTTGTLKLKLTRQRFSGLHRQLEARVGGGVYEQLAPVEESLDDQGNTRYTWYMEQASKIIEQHPGITTNTIAEQIGKKRELVIKAINALVQEGFVRRQDGPNRSHEHVSVSEFRDV